MRIVAAMSGGVDSAVAAARMLELGHDVVGVHLALSQSPATLRASARGCCSIEDAGDARRVADRLGIAFYVWDLAEEFRREVVDDFVSEYAVGRTPNPCLRCNERIKFAALLDTALALGFDGVATGHYARVAMPGDALNTTGRRELHRAVDAAKDQSYVLGVLDVEQLAGVHLPLGDSTKDVVRAEAAARGFSVARKPDSHDICFIPDGDTRAFLAARLGDRPGPIVDADGAVVGEHRGTYGFTVGQRRGLELRRPASDGRPRYVVGVDVARGEVLVGPNEMLGIDVVRGRHGRWCGEPLSGEMSCAVQLRAHGEEIPATARTVEVSGAPSPGADPIVEIRLSRRTRGVAAGQSAVLYDGTRVVGSVTIDSTARL
ncbi:MAG: tRNA 2-thiouridine(34) synthase MnmA [Dermatophilaceae bacterium]